LLEHDYTAADKLLHRLALGVPTVAELSFDVDQRASKAAEAGPEIAGRPHVFVTGLARAGTTIILRHLCRSGPFRSLNYRDMPFVLAPNLWKRFSSGWQRRQDEHLRAHGDRIMVNADSPEALEEVFWRIFSGADYIRANGLLPYRPNKAVLSRFRNYIAAILASGEPGQTRYLSKNNNNILRLPALRDTFPQSQFVIPFRHPASHARSLWNQHQHFCRMQKENPFVRSYMDWLAHHEFGLGHRPFLFSGKAPSDLSQASPDYWLDLWTRTHEALTEGLSERDITVCYEDLCSDETAWIDLTRRLKLAEPVAPEFSAAESDTSELFDPQRLKRAEAIYEQLRLTAKRSRDSQ
jgi:hypothetical protein